MHQMPTPADTPKSGVASTTGQRKPRKPRGRGLRTTTGCAVCRKRHMKCDEVKPTCGPCAKGKRECVYGSAAVEAAKSPPTAPGSVSDTESRSGPPQLQHNSWPQRPLLLQQNQIHAGPIGTPTSQPSDIKYAPLSATSSFTSQSWDSHENPRCSPGSDADLAQLPWNQTYRGSQTSTPLSSLGPPDPFRWFGMLAEDAPVEGEGPYSTRQADIAHFHQQSCQSSPGGRMSESEIQGYPTPQMQQLNSPTMMAPASMHFPTPRSSVPVGDERELWQAPITLTENEISLFRTFVDEVSLWLDLFDPLKHFSTLVPQLALSNEGLMKAILALSARHLSPKEVQGDNTSPHRTQAVQYYSETLQYLQRAMKFESYTRSPDIIATSLIVSAYEMIDGSGKSWERHLKGVFWIQRSQDNDGESGGLRQAVWWAWLRQDVWAAFRERRRCFSYWKPTKPYCRMDQYEIALRVVYILAQAVNYASDEERRAGEMNVQARAERADYLLGLLEDWKRHLTVHFQTLPVKGPEGSAFKPIWINPPALGVAIQMYHFARILLLVHSPIRGSYPENRNASIADSIDIIGGIAMTISDTAAAIVSIQALYCAGQYTVNPVKQAAIARMIDEHQELTGWPVIPLADELRAEWAASGPFMFPTPPDEGNLLPDKYFDTPVSMCMEGMTGPPGMC